MNKKKIFSQKKNAQAALEFLITYGWAILSVLIVIATLAYFGIFNPSTYVNDVCEFGDQMKCEDYIIYPNSTIQFRVRNNFGVPIDITRAVIRSDYGTSACDPDKYVMPNISIMPGYIFEVTCNITDRTLSSADKIRVKPILEFRKTGVGNPLHNQSGTIYTGVAGP